MAIDSPIFIAGMGALSALGESVEDHHAAVLSKVSPFRPLGELLGMESPHAALPGAWISQRGVLTNRKWSPVTMAALHVARQAVAAAGWSADELSESALIVGTSRGNAAGWLNSWPGRRPFKLMAASNTIHSESCSAISIELGIYGPNQVTASGCAAGLDALGMAMMMVRSGMAPRALVVAVDLPLVPVLLDSYAGSGLLAKQFQLDPYHPQTSGFIPSEGAAAMAIGHKANADPRLLYYSSNSDGVDPLGIPSDGGRTGELIKHALRAVGTSHAICPHATGTSVQGRAEPEMFRRLSQVGKVTLHPLKPYLGHTIGASGLLETVVLTRFLQDGKLPPNREGLSEPAGFTLPTHAIDANSPVIKLSHGMGGHNSILAISPNDESDPARSINRSATP
ncbi:hypothetical protein JIN85_01500 [Luteolibacter pohnpeiensis]|uniref:Ketosynthase family 3 (KS3) domain-containing protein n=1 Tax=Luteolibacter pohnpeiensis TaxID=454153 RepID=A0A934S7D6_9BACT|nr:beta-ketoacyl synthase N-terminal-like domain-containing protein [Luteolibacter pohnpeiensis]MBK1881067.1 hypothetical protein [Luteolibacter pohnpeiensis]